MMEPLRIHSVTWNVNARDIPASTDCAAILGPAENYQNQKIDIYAIGFQEVSARFDKYLFDNLVSGDDCWSLSFRNVLVKHSYVKVRTIRLLGIVLNVFCLRKHLPHLRNIETQYTRLALGGYVGLKGAVSVRLELYGVSYCFVNSHLTAHDHLLDTRIQEYNTVVETHKYKNRDSSNILYHDYIFWMGDLNFRLQEGSFDFEEIVGAIKSGKLDPLLEADQLKLVRDSEQAFHELDDTTPTFPPTYKFTVGGGGENPNATTPLNQYDAKRRPAWTDRILHRVNVHNYEDLGPEVELDLRVDNYSSHPAYTCSDHKPVSMTLTSACFGLKLASDKNIMAYNPVINFIQQQPPSWFVNEDAKISYTVEQNAGQILDSWDWIGLYHENFTSLDEYVTFCWSSSCRRTGLPKTCLMSSTALYAPGRFVLVYTSASQSILGISPPFNVIHRPKGDELQDDGNHGGREGREGQVEMAEEATAYNDDQSTTVVAN